MAAHGQGDGGMSMRTMVHSLTELAVRYGEDTIQNYLRTFSCPPNSEVEQFLRDKALTSAKLSTSQTYLVVDEATNILLGYYMLVLKSFSVKGSQLSSNNRRLISRFAEEDADGNFHAAVYLIAQIGKNFAVETDKRIPGSELIGKALDEFRAIKSRVGGKLVMVEREDDRPKLLTFYQANGFKSWTKRSDAKDNVRYDQMFATL